MAIRVNPNVARKGKHLGKSFQPDEMNLLHDFCEETERAMRKLGIPGRVVYSLFPNWGKRNGDMWQVFVVEEKHITRRVLAGDQPAIP